MKMKKRGCLLDPPRDWNKHLLKEVNKSNVKDRMRHEKSKKELQINVYEKKRFQWTWEREAIEIIEALIQQEKEKEQPNHIIDLITENNKK